MTAPLPIPSRAALDAFARDLDALLDETRAALGPDDLAHLRKIERWARACTAVGWATAWIAPNPVSMLALSTGRHARWTMIAHHVSHRGYDRVPGTPETRTSRAFARGRRRFIDWLDWIEPEAWDHEHNRLHHYRLGEEADPDLVQRNMQWLRDLDEPAAKKLARVLLLAATWKATYYGPNTLRMLREKQARDRDEAFAEPDVLGMFRHRETWTRCVLPYVALQLGLFPALFAPLGPGAVASAWVNSLGAEVLTNLHTFLVITTNHAGEDMVAFDGPARGRPEFYWRQVVGSTNYRTGGDLNDFLHGFLNYQIEHHLFPDLPMRALQRIQPRVKEICERHGVPYVQEPIGTRLRKTLDVMIGRASMRRAAPRAAAEATAG